MNPSLRSKRDSIIISNLVSPSAMVGSDVSFIVPRLRISSLLVAYQPQVFVGLSLPTSSDSTVAPKVRRQRFVPQTATLKIIVTPFSVIFFSILGVGGSQSWWWGCSRRSAAICSGRLLTSFHGLLLPLAAGQCGARIRRCFFLRRAVNIQIIAAECGGVRQS
jgi:hypothetical protein